MHMQKIMQASMALCLTYMAFENRENHIAGTQFVALVVPSCPGALYDLASSPYMAVILKTFVSEKS